MIFLSYILACYFKNSATSLLRRPIILLHKDKLFYGFCVLSVHNKQFFNYVPPTTSPSIETPKSKGFSVDLLKIIIARNLNAQFMLQNPGHKVSCSPSHLPSSWRTEGKPELCIICVSQKRNCGRKFSVLRSEISN